MNTAKVTIQATIAATPKKVWEFYTEPEHITNWNFASDDWCCPSAENDMQVGGKYKARMEAKEGSFGFDFEAEYSEVTEFQSFTYAMVDGRAVTTTFEGTNDSTKVTTVFDAETQNDVEMQRAGWQSILENFKKYTEAN